MEHTPLGLLRVKVIALAVTGLQRARRFYGETLGLPPAYEGMEHVGYLLGGVILMLKADAAVTPTAMPNPRITLDTENARQAEAGPRARGVAIADPVARYGGFDVGSFLDSEGNKLWFCSAV